ncbi:MAG: helix-turn-helix domain-containing protein [Gemmatimonadota bacterium]|nr:helix-turn-helix domain-containing protein [Gemmatimonadota bacterium]
MARRKHGDTDEIDGTSFTKGSGNVFSDLNLPDAEERLAKANLARQIAVLLGDSNQKEAAVRLGIDQPKVSALSRGKLDQFSTERLIGFLTRLGQNVEIHVKPVTSRRKNATGHLLVVAHS